MKKYKQKPSQTPPGGLNPNEVPQFVALGFDDNESVPELEWISKFSRNLKNRDNTPVRFSFYNNGKFTNAESTWKQLYDEGHEIGDHTFNHPHGQKTDWEQDPPEYTVLMDRTKWKEEIEANRAALTKAGIDCISGFRTPFLEFTDETFKAVSEAGYAYDCSIEEGYQPDQHPGNFYWPYTLDEGSPGDTAFSLNVPGREPVGIHPGLWEMPVYLLQVPDDKKADIYGFNKGLREQIAKEKPYVKESNWKITGFDWNLWYTDDGKPFLKPEDVLGILKYNLDLHFEGNRTPFMFGSHIDLYNTPERRKALEDFILYALEKDNTKVSTVKDILKWIQNPEKI